ncbi:MAG: oxidoreductase [Acidobacteria bacterium]|nr:oxidoreductase [Acidobacteriota bacterium]
MNLSEYDISNPYEATLVASERITPKTVTEVRHLVLQLPEGHFDFVEGQSIGVLIPGPHEFGNPRHFRLYSIASSRQGENGKGDAISICVRRCFYLDEVSGERYPGKASNFLCDARPGDRVLITGPYGSHFSVPPDDSANILMVGAGTGIAPFRAFVLHIYQGRGGWKGKVRLFYGARTGMEMLYRNEINRDLALYYSEESFQAFEAVSPRPYLDEEPTLDRLLVANQFEVWEMIQDPKTHVYLAGLAQAEEKFEKAMIVMAGSKEAWLKRRAEMIEQGRYAEVLY